MGTSVPASIAMLVGLLYLYHSRSQPVSEERQIAHSPHKLMLVEVPEGENVDLYHGRPINPDIMQTGRSAMSAYDAIGHPNPIQVLPPHDQSQMPPGSTVFNS